MGNNTLPRWISSFFQHHYLYWFSLVKYTRLSLSVRMEIVHTEKLPKMLTDLRGNKLHSLIGNGVLSVPSIKAWRLFEGTQKLKWGWYINLSIVIKFEEMWEKERWGGRFLLESRLSAIDPYQVAKILKTTQNGTKWPQGYMCCKENISLLVLSDEINIYTIKHTKQSQYQLYITYKKYIHYIHTI